MDYSDRETFRFGSARFANTADLAAAGMTQQSPSSLFLGFYAGKPVWYDGAGGLLLVAGARSGKLRDVLAYNICAGICREMTLLILDVKGELAAISQDQTSDRKHCLYWNPLGLHGLPQHRINPTGYLRWSSPTLFSDTKIFLEELLPQSGAAAGAYFELNGRRYGEAITLTLAKINGVVTLPDLTRVIGSIPEGGQDWLDFAWEMHRSGIDLCRTVEAEIAAAREDSSGGFRGIIGELQKAVACLSDPVLRDAVSPPFDFDLADLSEGERFRQFYLMAPVEVIGAWAPVIKAIFTAAMIHKARKPDAPRQTWVLDECAQLKGFDLITKMFSYGAGIGIRPYAVFQEIAQLDDLGRGARRIIPASAAVQSYFGLRDYDSAKRVSDMLGVETLEYFDHLIQGRARREGLDLLRGVFAGQSAFTAAARIDQFRTEHRLEAQSHRLLQTPDEVMNMAADRQFIFADGLPGALLATRAPYWQQRFMAGRFHPNPYHPPTDSVAVRERWGMRRRPVLTGPVPETFADYPQYRNGQWSYIGR